MTRCTLALSVLLALIGAAQVEAAVVVEFSEVSLPNLSLLDSTTHFDAYGLSFEDTTYIAFDTRFPPAGVDNWGITTTDGPDNLMTVVFTPGAYQATFDWLTLAGNSIYADVYDSGDNLLDSQSATGLSGTSYGTFTFSGVGSISKAKFYDDTGMIGVGRVEYNPIPEPASLIVWSLLIGLTFAGGARRLFYRQR